MGVTSGSFNTAARVSGSYNTYAKFSWTQTSQSIDGNYTDISWTLKGVTANAYQWIHVYGIEVIVNGTNTGVSWSGDMYNGTQMASGTARIYHNADGSKSFSASAKIQQYSTAASSWYSGSGSWDLNTIPRASTPSLSNSTFNIGDTITINTNRASSSFTHTISITYGSTTTQIATGVGASVSYNTSNIANAMYGVIPNGTSFNGTITCVTYSGSTNIGSKTCSYTAKAVEANAKPTFSNFTYSDTNSTVTNVTGNNQYLVQGKSTLAVVVSTANKAVANKSASMSSYTSTISGLTATGSYSASSNVTMTFSSNAFAAGSQTLAVKATDSRGYSTTVSKNVTVLAYAAPVINASATRTNNYENTTTLVIKGSYSPLTISGTAKNTVSSVKYRYKKQSETTWSSWEDMAGLNVTSAGVYTTTNKVLEFDNSYAWDVQVQTVDRLSTSTANLVVSVGIPIFRIGTDGYVYNNEKRILNQGDVRHVSAVTDAGWSAEQNKLVDGSVLAFWNGAYSGTASNISNLASNAVKTANITNQAVTAAKLKATDAWILLGTTHNTAAVTNGQVLKVDIPSDYRNSSLKVYCKLELSANGWVDLRAYDASGNLLKYTVNTTYSVNGGVHGFGSEGMNYFCGFVDQPGTYKCCTMEATSIKYAPSANYRDWNGQSGNGWSCYAWNALQANNTAIASIRLFTGGTCQNNAILKVFGMLD